MYSRLAKIKKIKKAKQRKEGLEAYGTGKKNEAYGQEKKFNEKAGTQGSVTLKIMGKLRNWVQFGNRL